MRNKAISWGLIGAALSLTTYLLTIAPGLTWANYGVDGGELTTAAYTLGVPHPSGYPTFILLGKLFSYLPVGTVALRLNLLSATAMAASVGFVTATTYTLLPEEKPRGRRNSGIAALAAGLTFGLAPLVWGQAIITEVYGLNLAALSILIWSIQTKQPAWLSGPLLGISITTHLTSVFFIPLTLFLVPRKSWHLLLTGALVGLAPFLVIPVFARSDSPVIWGNPTTPESWWWLVSGQLYRSNVLSLPLPDLIRRTVSWGPYLLGQFTVVGSLLIAAGTRMYWRRWPERVVILVLTATLYVVYALSYSSVDAIVFLLPALMLLAPFLAPAMRPFGALALLLPLFSLLLNFSHQDLSHEREEIKDRAVRLLESTPRNAILLTPGDATIFTLWYFQHVEGSRPDVVLVDENLFAFDWYRQRLQMQYTDLNGLGDDDLVAFTEHNDNGRLVCHGSIASPDSFTTSFVACNGKTY